MRKAMVSCLIVLGVVLCGREAGAASCTISTAPVAFGTYDVFTPTSLDSNGSVTLRCTGNASNVMITIDPGQGGAFAQRKLFLNAAEWLGYNLYRNAARTNVWGDGTGGTSFYSAASVPNNTNIPISIFGRIPPSQDVRAGAYADNLSVTVNF